MYIIMLEQDDHRTRLGEAKDDEELNALLHTAISDKSTEGVVVIYKQMARIDKGLICIT